MDGPTASRMAFFWRLLSALLAISTPVASQVGQHTLYPYGPQEGDMSVGDIGQKETPVTLPIPCKYNGQSFKTAYILKDGMVAFASGVTYQELEWREGTPNHAIDLPFIAPFHHYGFVAFQDPASYPGRIYYKLLSRSRGSPQLSDKDRRFMEDLDKYLLGASVAVKSDFRSEFVLKVTWENVTSRDHCDDRKLQTSQGCPYNTFQVLIVGNVDHTFVIFDYLKMNIPFSTHHLAGLNGGYGRGWTDVVPCGTACAERSRLNEDRIKSLSTRAGSDVRGRYIMYVGEDNVVRGGCIPDGLKSAELEVYPRQAGMWGGRMLAVSGYCHNPGTKIYCRFAKDDQTTTEGVMETRMRGRCPVPILTTRGEVLVEMSTDNVAWTHQTNMTINFPERIPLLPELKAVAPAWYTLTPSKLEVQWPSQLFSRSRGAKLDLNLIGYRENKHSNTPVEWKFLEQLATSVLNTDQRHTIDPRQFACKSGCDDFEVALVQLKVQDGYIDEATQFQSINLAPVTLGWYVNKAMTELHGDQWPSTKCKAWSDQDKLQDDWLSRLLPCPCNLTQALADWGRWQPDVGCSMFNGSTCSYHVGALHCVRSVHPSPDGSGNQCCYEKDGSLRYAADTYQGSTPDRSHAWGATPYGKPDHVPSMSHWIHDVVTFYYCCLWVNNRDCYRYMDRRPTRDCVDYQPSHSAAIFGDPHVITFDNQTYHFGGSGDFWIIKSDVLNIQGRFIEKDNDVLKLEPNQLGPTNLSMVVAWMGGSDVVTVRMAPPGGPKNRKLDIVVGKRRRIFEDVSLMWQDFSGVSITNNAPIAQRHQEDMQHSNFTIMFSSGAAVQVSERHGLLHVIAVLPPESGKTQGLLGTLDGDGSNDFTTPNGQVIPRSSNEDTIYIDFAMKWAVPNSQSKFHWPRKLEDQRTPLFGNPRDFPYINLLDKPSEQSVRQVCGHSKSCARDYYVTRDTKVALVTKRTEDVVEHTRNAQTKLASCGLLDIPMAEKSQTVYLLGSRVEVVSCRPDQSDVVGSGPTSYHCTNTPGSSPTPKWTPTPDPNLCPYTGSSSKEASNVGMIVGIVVGVIAVLVIIIIVVVVLLKRRGKSGNNDVNRPTPARRTPADVIADPSTGEKLLRDREGVRMSDVKPRTRGSEAV